MYSLKMRGALLLAVVACAAGCHSVLPEEEVAEASQIVVTRTGIDPGWRVGAEVERDDYQGNMRPLAAPLTLDEATRRALRHHPRIHREIASLAERRAVFVQAHLLPNPVLQGLYGVPTDGGGGDPVMASLVTQLSALWTRPARIDSADADLRAGVLSLSDVALRLAAEVRTLYAETVHGGHRVELDQSIVGHLEASLALEEDAFEAGEGTRREVNAARLQLARARDRALTSAATLEATRRRFLERVASPEAEAQGLELAPTTLPEFVLPLTERAAFERAATERLDVVAAFVAWSGAGAQERLAEIDRWGAVGLGVGFQENFTRREAANISLSWSLPLFDTGRAALAKSRAIERRTLEEARGILHQALREARIAHVALTSELARLEHVETDWQPAAAENLNLAQEAFAAGEESRSAVLREEVRVLEVKRAQNEMQLAARRAHFELERAVGGRIDSATESDADSALPREEVAP